MLWSRRNKQAALLLKERQEKLTAAVEEGRTANVWLMLEQDKDLVHYKNHTVDKKKKKKKDGKDKEYCGETALHIAANNNDLATAAVLIQVGGAKVNAENDKGETALHLASKKLNVDFVKFLIAKGASVDERSNLGWTALHYVSCYAKMKRRKTPNGDKATAKKQNTSIDIALVHVLIDNGAHVNSQTNAGWTPLHWAALKGNEDILFALMDRGGDLSITNNKGKTPYQLANHGMKPEQLRAYQQSLETASTAALTTTATSTENSSPKDIRSVAVEKLRAMQDAASYLSEQEKTEMASLLTEVNVLHDRLSRFQSFSELLHHVERPKAITHVSAPAPAATTKATTTRSSSARDGKVPTEITIILSSTSSTSDTSETTPASLEPKRCNKRVLTRTPSSPPTQRFAYF